MTIENFKEATTLIERLQRVESVYEQAKNVLESLQNGRTFTDYYCNIYIDIVLKPSGNSERIAFPLEYVNTEATLNAIIAVTTKEIDSLNKKFESL